MLGNLEEMQKAGRMQLDTASRSALVFVKGAQRVASESVEQTRDTMERCSNYFEKISNARSVEDAFKINSEFASANWERFFSGATRFADACASMAKDATTPMRESAPTPAQPRRAA